MTAVKDKNKGKPVPDEVLDAEVVGEPETVETPTEPAIPAFDFAPRVVQTADQLRAKVQERIKAHEELLSEEELNLWEVRVTGGDTTAIETAIRNRKTLIAVYVESHNNYFENNQEA